MKLLFDQQLSYKLVGQLEDLFPGSKQVKLEGLDTSDDLIIWEFARENGFSIVTKDADFFDIGLVKGYPPKVIWLRCGNATSQYIEQILRNNFDSIKEFLEDLPQICLELS